MAKANLSSKSAPKIELDDRTREARLRLAHIERHLVPHAGVKDSWLARLFGLRRSEAPRRQEMDPFASDRKESCMPEIDDCLEPMPKQS